MQYYYDLEVNILSCLIQKPILMKQLKLEDKYFIKHQRIWQFMKSFYKKFETFDVVLMFNICKDKFQIIKYLEILVNSDPITSNFNLYQDELIKLYNQKKKEKWIIEKVFELSNELYVGNINLEKFKVSIDKIEKDAESIFKGGDK